MVNLLLVCRMGGPIDLAKEQNCDLIQQVKQKTLRYGQVLISRGSEPETVSVRQAPLGAVRSQADADRFIEALSQCFPQRRFIAVNMPCERGEEIVFVPHDDTVGSYACLPPERLQKAVRFDRLAPTPPPCRRPLRWLAELRDGQTCRTGEQCG